MPCHAIPCHMEWLNRVCVGNQDDKLDLFVLDYVFFIAAAATAAVILTCTTPTLLSMRKRKSRKSLLKLVHRLDNVLCNKIIYFRT